MLVIDLGRVKVDSRIVEFNHEKDYKREDNFMLLYDAYNFTLKDMQILAFDALPNYHKYTLDKSTKIIQNVTLSFKFYYNIEEFHPNLPLFEINCSLTSISIIVSDFIA